MYKPPKTISRRMLQGSPGLLVDEVEPEPKAKKPKREQEWMQRTESAKNLITQFAIVHDAVTNPDKLPRPASTSCLCSPSSFPQHGHARQSKSFEAELKIRQSKSFDAEHVVRVPTNPEEKRSEQVHPSLVEDEDFAQALQFYLTDLPKNFEMV